MTDSNIVVYGVNWCWDCRRTRKFLDQNDISYDFINIDNDLQGKQFVLKVNHGMRSVPTLLFQDGTILVEPSNAELAHKLKLNCNV